MDNLRQGMGSIFLAQLHKDKKFLVKGCLDRYRDFIYIDDVIDVLVQNIENPITYGKSYNVGTGVKTSVRSLILEMLKVYGIEENEAPIKIDSGTPGDQFGIYSDISKINNETGWAPRFSLDEGLGKMVSWIKNT